MSIWGLCQVFGAAIAGFVVIACIVCFLASVTELLYELLRGLSSFLPLKDRVTLGRRFQKKRLQKKIMRLVKRLEAVRQNCIYHEEQLSILREKQAALKKEYAPLVRELRELIAREEEHPGEWVPEKDVLF